MSVETVARRYATALADVVSALEDSPKSSCCCSGAESSTCGSVKIVD